MLVFGVDREISLFFDNEEVHQSIAVSFSQKGKI